MRSEHFSEKELSCRCGCGLNLATPSLLAALEDFRAIVGRPVLVLSATRCAKRNAQVGGAPNSYHLAGFAADVTVKGRTAADLVELAKEIPNVHGIGVDYGRNYIHFDVRNAPLVMWAYNPQGQVIPYYRET